MARALRIAFEGAIYHVMNRGIARRDVFPRPVDYERFLDSLALGVERTRVRIYAYALLPNHFHLLVETPEANISAFMLSVQTSYAVYFNQRYRKSGYVFEGPYRAKLVEGDTYLLALSRYLHLNPVATAAFQGKSLDTRRKALRAYPWSSHREYMGTARRKEWMRYGPLEELIRDRGGSYRAYVEAGLAENDGEFATILKASPVAIGSGSFVAGVEDRYARRRLSTMRREDVAFRRIGRWLTPETILRVIEQELEIPPGAWRRRRGMAWSRGLAAWMLVRYGGLTQRAVADLLGLSTGAAVSFRLRALNEQCREDPRLATRLAAVEKRLAQHLA